MEMQAISCGGRWYATVFVVQNQDITVMVTVTAPERSDMQSWLQQRGYPAAGTELRLRPDHQLQPGYFINPGLKQFYYAVDPVTNELTGVPPQEFESPVPLESSP